MNTFNYKRSVVEKVENLTAFSIVDATGKLVIDLISTSSRILDKKSYTIDLAPLLIEWSIADYDAESFSAIIQEYIVYLQQNEEKDTPFRLAIIRKSDISDSFYEKVWSLLESYADKITIKAVNNMMILNCD